MNEPLKQRLVGALILVALGVVFWPIIFVQPTEESAESVSAIPPRPDVSNDPVPAPEPVGLRESKPIAAASQPQPVQPVQDDVAVREPVAPPPEPEEQSTARGQAPEPLAIDDDGVPLAWILQVVTVSSKDKADAVREQLLAMDQKAYAQKIVRDGKTLYRVYVGPKFERAKLEKLQSSIDKAFGVDSIVVRYLP